MFCLKIRRELISFKDASKVFHSVYQEFVTRFRSRRQSSALQSQISPVVSSVLRSVRNYSAHSTKLIVTSLSASLSTQVYKWVLANIMLGGSPAMNQHPIQGEQKYSQSLHATENRIISRLMTTCLMCRLNLPILVNYYAVLKVEFSRMFVDGT